MRLNAGMRWYLALPVFLAAPALAYDGKREVDLELFLAVDVSRSMSPAELEIQRQGYAAALSSDAVWGAIRSGLIGEIAVTYVEWAGAYSQNIVVDWTVIETREDANAIAETITSHFDPGLRRTSISGILHYARHSIADNDISGLRRVIDISGDGPNNQGDAVTRARDRTLSEGITINGLPLMTTDALSEMWGIPDLDVYYSECVIGGPGHFLLPVHTWEDFAPSIERKLVLEISGVTTPSAPRVQPASGYDCLIGEKIMERNRAIFSEP
jgi:hypothetical protein